MALTDRPTLAAAAGAACIASSATLVRLADVEPATAATFRCLYALPVLGVLLLREDRRYGTRPARDRWLAAASGVFFAIDLVLWHHAIAAVGAGIATVLGNLQVDVAGDAVTSRIEVRASHRGAGEKKDQTYDCMGHYQDRWTRTPDGWRIAHRAMHLRRTPE